MPKTNIYKDKKQLFQTIVNNLIDWIKTYTKSPCITLAYPPEEIEKINKEDTTAISQKYFSLFLFGYFEAVILAIGKKGFCSLSSYFLESFLRHLKLNYKKFTPFHVGASGFITRNWDPNLYEDNIYSLLSDFVIQELHQDPNTPSKERLIKQFYEIEAMCNRILQQYLARPTKENIYREEFSTHLDRLLDTDQKELEELKNLYSSQILTYMNDGFSPQEAAELIAIKATQQNKKKSEQYEYFSAVRKQLNNLNDACERGIDIVLEINHYDIIRAKELGLSPVDVGNDLAKSYDLILKLSEYMDAVADYLSLYLDYDINDAYSIVDLAKNKLLRKMNQGLSPEEAAKLVAKGYGRT